MSLVALQALRPGINSIGLAADNSLILPDAPAHLLQLEPKIGTATVHSADRSLRFHGLSVNPGAQIVPAEEDQSSFASGTLKIWLIPRGNQQYLRVKDFEAPALNHFHDLRWYAPSSHYRVMARWVPDALPHKLRVTNRLGQVSESSGTGHVQFNLDGKKQSLIPLEASAASLWFVFRDQTYRKDTDQGGRFLTVKGPANGLEHSGEVQLNLNEAVNPPCAYSPYGTCPLASEENQFTVAIGAGEKRYNP